MSELATFIALGFRHVADLRAADHILFLVVLGAVYRPRDWKAALVVVSAFTVGHSVTLALAAIGWLRLPTSWIEFLIPVTILVTGAANLGWVGRGGPGAMALHRPVAALAFGLVHGAGFANYLRALLSDELVLPLLGFNLGVEAGQVAILLVAMASFVTIDEFLRRARRWTADGAFRLRLAGVSAGGVAVATIWAWQRFP